MSRARSPSTSTSSTDRDTRFWCPWCGELLDGVRRVAPGALRVIPCECIMHPSHFGLDEFDVGTEGDR